MATPLAIASPLEHSSPHQRGRLVAALSRNSQPCVGTFLDPSRFHGNHVLDFIQIYVSKILNETYYLFSQRQCFEEEELASFLIVSGSCVGGGRVLGTIVRFCFQLAT